MGKKRWWGMELANLKADYDNHNMTISKVATKHRTSLGTVARMARNHNWVPRRPNAHDPKIRGMKIRRAFVAKRIEDYQREYARLDHKIKFLESLNDR